MINTCTRDDISIPVNPATLQPKEVSILLIHERFLMQESSNKHYLKNGNVRISSKGAIGLWQIMIIGLEEYNRNHDLKFGTNGLYLLWLNKHIGKWILNDNIEYFSKMGYDKYISTLLGINAYNHGKQGTKNGNIANKYLSNIVPTYYTYFIAHHEIVRTGTKILTVASLRASTGLSDEM